MNRFFRYLVEFIHSLFELLVSPIPGRMGRLLRYIYYGRRLKHLGKKVNFGVGVRIYGPEWVHIGDYCWIDDYAIILAGPINETQRFVYRKSNPLFVFQEGEVAIGDRVHIAPYVQLQGHGGLQIGNSLTIAAGAKIYTLSHHHRDLTGKGDPNTVWKFVGLVPAEEQALICAPVVIGDSAAVGLNSVVLPGSTIGSNSWLGAMSLLQGTLPPNVIATGIPAQIIRNRFA